MSGGEEEEEVDPRVKVELDALNCATDDINVCETEISQERSKFRGLLNDATQQLSVLSKKSGKSIEKARSYYETIKEVKQAQAALELAVQNFQKSNGVHRAAKETISLAEQRFSEFDNHKMDAAWQEVMNVQTIRFMQAESDRSRSEKIHQQAAVRFEFLQKKANKLLKKHKNSIRRTFSYYEAKEKLESKLQKQQKRVNDLQQKIKDSKQRYQGALANLEKISLEIHEQRKVAKLKSKMLDRVDGEGCAADDGISAMADQFDLKQPKTYDDIEELEEELDGFDFLEDDSFDDDEFSTDEEWSGSSECSEKLSSPTSPRVFRRSSSRVSRRQSSESAVKIAPQRSVSRRSLKKLIPPVEESLPEENELFVNDSSSSNSTYEKTKASQDSTYDTLHGVSTTTAQSHKEQVEYDIFDDLC